MPKSKEVDAWFARYDNPMKAVVQRIREIVLAADPRIEECIKWQAPTFVFRGNLASFFPRSKQHASLMFHLGARIPGKHSRLEGTGETSRVMKLGSLAESSAARRDIEKLVVAWCEWREAEAGGARPKAKRMVCPQSTRAASAKRPAVPAKRPAASAKRTAASAKRPAASAERPAAPAKRPAASAKRPAASAKRPAAPAKRPAASAKRPAASAKRPARPAKRAPTSANRAPASAKRPAASAKPLASKHARTGAAGRRARARRRATR